MDHDFASPGAADGPRRGPSVGSSVGVQPHGEALGSLAEALDRLLCKGVSVDGAVTIGLAGVELLLLDLRLLLAAVDTIDPEGSFFSASAGPTAPPRPPVPPALPLGSTGPLDPSTAPTLATRTSADESSHPTTLSAAAVPGEEPRGRKGPQHGLVRLVLTLVNLLHEVLERQAVRRMGNGTLTPAQIEDVGAALYAQAMEIARLRQQFGLSETDLTLRLSATG